MVYNVHQTHKTRGSDSSLYDERCIYCGATDAAGDERLNQECPKAPKPEPNEAQVSPSQSLSGTKLTIANFLSTLDDEHLILHLTHVAEIWFKDADILALEEFIRRFKARTAND